MESCRARVVAWGECGLDYCKNWAESAEPLERQRMLDVFARQARLALSLRLPLVVHSRQAEADTLQVLLECLPRDHKVHIHAYQGAVSMMLEALKLMPNCIFGASFLVAMGAEGAVEVVKHCPLDRL